jgi:hypothetical protein
MLHLLDCFLGHTIDIHVYREHHKLHAQVQGKTNEAVLSSLKLGYILVNHPSKELRVPIVVIGRCTRSAITYTSLTVSDLLVPTVLGSTCQKAISSGRHMSDIALC